MIVVFFLLIVPTKHNALLLLLTLKNSKGKGIAWIIDGLDVKAAPGSRRYMLIGKASIKRQYNALRSTFAWIVYVAPKTV